MTNTIFSERDYFTDLSVLLDPYEYFEEVRAHGPIYQMASHDVLMVTGYYEAVEILRNNKDFSSFQATSGSAQPLPFTPEGHDISAQIAAHRSADDPMNLLVTYDGVEHSNVRSIVNRLFTPKRLKALYDYISALSLEMVTDAVSKRGCDIVNDIATPYVTMVIADLMGVPAADRKQFSEAIDAAPPPGDMNKTESKGPSPMEIRALHFLDYLQQRRETPVDDLLSELATASYPDGSMPDIIELVKLGVFMFGAGQDTSAKLLSNSLRYLGDYAELQQQLRTSPDLIPAFMEEVLRLEGSTKTTFRICVRDTEVAGIKIPAGKRITIALAAANRDPRRWEAPHEFQLNRPRIKEHLAFGRGVHTCAGAPLAREEVRIMLEHLFDYTSDIGIDEAHHGVMGHRNYQYEPSFIIRGLANLHIKLKAA